MAKTSSKKSRKSAKKPPIFILKIKSWIKKQKDENKKHVHLHKSFRRSYREDYNRKFEAPGLLYHAATTFRLIFRNWRTFLPFIIAMMALYIVLVGLMSEDYYTQLQESVDEASSDLAVAGGGVGNFAKAGMLLLSTILTGGLDGGGDEVQTIFMILLFLVMWLVTIYLLRHYFVGKKLKLRDALYNALGPLISTICIFALIFVQAIPAMLVAITYSAAVATGFLSTPFYALIYFIFAAAMILLTVYLLSSSLIALIAVTTPGMYPMTALRLASDLMAGRRIRLILRAIYLLIVVVMVFIVVMLPIILLDLWLKSIWEWIAGWPIVPFCLLFVTCFVFIYVTSYLYRYYRWMLDYKE